MTAGIALVAGGNPASADVSGSPSEPVRIMPLGDSITKGLGSSTMDGYRADLSARLTAAGVDHDFVGTAQDGIGTDTDHEGHSGWRIDQVHAQVTDWMQATAPDVVLLNLGTNDALQNYQTDAAPARLSLLIDAILASSPTVRVVVAKLVISHLPPRPWVTPAVHHLNTAVPTVVQTKGARVSLADLSRVSWRNTTDGVHPNDLGYRQIAFQWFQALRPVLPTGTSWPATSDPFPAPNVTTTRSAAAVTRGHRVTVTGRLTGNLTHVDLGGVTVQLWYRRAGQPTWTLHSTGTTTPAGVVVFHPTMYAKGHFVVRVASGPAARRISPATWVGTRAQLLRLRTITAGTTRKITGHVRTGQPTTVRLQRSTPTGWTTTARTRTSGTFRFTVKPGTHQYRLVVEPTAWTTRTWSSPFTT
jgi:lysophospholipase L1-like esterase